MNWNNVNLNRPIESASDILDAYTFDQLLLEISCNLKEITPETVRKQAMESIISKHKTAIEIIEANLKNITDHAIKYREMA